MRASGSSPWQKRLFDALQYPLDVTGVLLWSPPFLVAFPIVWLLVRTRLGSPVFFAQVRPGRDGRLFTFYKFRSMTSAKDPVTGELLPDHARLTPLGRTLRRLSFDELPQIWNVLRGDISLVGPRALLLEYLSLYTPEQRRRLDVRPGITGWAQINGRNSISWEQKFELDTWYVEHRSLGLYFRILFLSVWKILRRHGVDASETTTMEKFKGSSRTTQESLLSE